MMKPFLQQLSMLGVFLISATLIQAQIVPGSTKSFIVREYANTFSGIKSLKIDAQFSKVEIAGCSGTEMSVAGKLISDKQDDAYQILVDNVNGDATINIKYPAQGWTSHSGELLIQLPAGVKVEVMTTSGIIRLMDVTDCEASIASRSGNIEVTNFKGNLKTSTATASSRIEKVTGNIQIASKTGAQYIQDITGDANLSSTEGVMTVTNVTGNLKTESTSGNQTMAQIQGSVTGKAVNGNVKVSESTCDVTMTTFAGAVNIHNVKGILNLTSTTGELVGARVTLTGSSNFKTTEGRIRMTMMNATSELTFNCHSENAFIQARGISKKKKLMSGKGAIVITTQSNTGGQVFN